MKIGLIGCVGLLSTQTLTVNSIAAFLSLQSMKIPVENAVMFYGKIKRGNRVTGATFGDIMIRTQNIGKLFLVERLMDKNAVEN